MEQHLRGELLQVRTALSPLLRFDTTVPYFPDYKSHFISHSLAAPVIYSQV